MMFSSFPEKTNDDFYSQMDNYKSSLPNFNLAQCPTVLLSKMSQAFKTYLGSVEYIT